MTHVTTSREHEIGRYVRAYNSPAYGMGKRRQDAVRDVFRHLPSGSVLDVGTGRGEALAFATELGHKPCVGTEVVPYLCNVRRDNLPERLSFLLQTNGVVESPAHDLPFNDASFDHVTCFDVLEHLVEKDLIKVLTEMNRIARRSITASASERPSFFGSPDGKDLHISARNRHRWMAMMTKTWAPARVKQIGYAGASPMFRIWK